MTKTDEVRSQVTWNWLKTGTLNNQTEGMLMAAKNQALRTNNIMSNAEKVFHPYVDCAEKVRKQCGC